MTPADRPQEPCPACNGTGIEPLPANTWSHAHDLRACQACGGHRPVAPLPAAGPEPEETNP